MWYRQLLFITLSKLWKCSQLINKWMLSFIVWNSTMKIGANVLERFTVVLIYPCSYNWLCGLDVNIRSMPWLSWVCYNSFLVSCIPRQYPWFMESPESSDPWGPKHFYRIEAPSLSPRVPYLYLDTGLAIASWSCAIRKVIILTDILVDCLLHMVTSLLKNWTGPQCLLTSVGYCWSAFVEHSNQFWY